MNKKDVRLLQDREASRWLALQEYDNRNAPDDGDFDKEQEWERTDVQHVRLLSAWCATINLLETLEIKEDLQHPDNVRASELCAELCTRRRVNKEARA
jgi:hypothetical protein